MTNQRLQVIGFFTLLGIAVFVVLMMFLPFFKIVALAAILAILFLPVHRRITRKLKSETWGAALSLLIILLIVILPLWLLGQLLFSEVVSLYSAFGQGGRALDPGVIAQHLPERLRPIAENLNEDLGQKISSLAGNAFRSITGILSNLAGFVLSFFLVFFSLYYFLRDGGSLKQYFNQIFPLSTEHENLLIKKLEDAVSGVVKGSFLVALSQGAVGTVGYLIFGLPNPFLWGAFTVLAALVPNVGTMLAWVPAVIYLLATGNTGQAVGMLIWSVLLTGTIDNIISPRLVGSKVRLHPLLVLLSILGGLQLFGFIGFLLGPIITAVTITLLDIYKNDLKSYMEK